MIIMHNLNASSKFSCSDQVKQEVSAAKTTSIYPSKLKRVKHPDDVHLPSFGGIHNKTLLYQVLLVPVHVPGTTRGDNRAYLTYVVQTSKLMAFTTRTCTVRYGTDFAYMVRVPVCPPTVTS
jgi:hypothetical protein